MKTNQNNSKRFIAVLVIAVICAGVTAWAQPGGGFGGGGFGGFGGFNQQRSTTSSATKTSYPSSTDIGQARITYDAETRSLIVVADDDTAAHIKDVVGQLDRPAPQVLIKCIFMEAVYSKDLDVGVDGSYTHKISSKTVPPLTGTGSASTAFDLARTFGATAGSGGLYHLLGSDLEVTLSALAKAGKTEILSRPSILARNNQQATINIGQQVPLITNTRFDTFGNQINSVSYQNVGISLQVTPFITSDNYVEMIVTPSTSELADRSQWVPISNGSTNNSTVVSAPVINSRSADTVVVVPDGQTVVIGGLMQTQRLNSESKVPILGDIPLIGLLFKHKVTNNAKTELLIFMTPHIVKDPRDLASVTDREKAATTIAPKAFSEEELNRYLNNTPEHPQKPAIATPRTSK